MDLEDAECLLNVWFCVKQQLSPFLWTSPSDVVSSVFKHWNIRLMKQLSSNIIFLLIKHISSLCHIWPVCFSCPLLLFNLTRCHGYCNNLLQNTTLSPMNDSWGQALCNQYCSVTVFFHFHNLIYSFKVIKWRERWMLVSKNHYKI